MTDYDHFHKKAARDADARIVARGGRSVFGPMAVYRTGSAYRYPRHGVEYPAADVKPPERTDVE